MENENLIDEENKISIYKLINSIFEDESKKFKIINRLRPYFSLKVIPNKEIDKVYSALEKIDQKKIEFVEEFKYEEEKFDSTNEFETKSKSIGLSNNDLDLSANIFSFSTSFGNHSKENNTNENYNKIKKIHCIHSIVVSLFRIVIDYKDIKLAKQVNEDLIEVENSNATEKKILLEKFVQKFGLYIPLELIVGGRINISFEAKNEEEKAQLHNNLQREIKANLEGKASYFNSKANFNFNNNNNYTNENSQKYLDSLQNSSIKMIGGDYLYKDNLQNWIKSFNINNLQVIEYKTLIPIYCFIPNLETKLKICLNDYEDIVFHEIFNLLETKYKIEEKNIFKGDSTKNNSWSAGIINNNYKNFDKIYQKKKTIEIDFYEEDYYENKKSEKEEFICGEIPEEYIICGWILSTNSNAKLNNYKCTWERNKDLGIIGSRYFKFKINAVLDNEEKTENDNKKEKTENDEEYEKYKEKERRERLRRRYEKEEIRILWTVQLFILYSKNNIEKIDISC